MRNSGRKVFNMIIALLVAIAAWVFVVYNYDPMTLVNYTGVPVEFTGETDLASRGLAVSSTSLEKVDVTLSQKRVDGGSISAADITVTADVSECVAGANAVNLKVSGPSGTTVSSVSASMADVEVSRTRSEVMDIDVAYRKTEDGTIEENEEPIAFDLSSESAEVSCSSEMFDKINRIAAVLDREDVANKSKSFTVDLQALDREGNAIPHVVITPKEISLDASAGYTKTVKLYLTVRDDSEDSYERKYTAPDKVTIKGTKEAINKVSSITAEDIDVSYEYADGDFDIWYNLPEGIYIADESLGQKVKLTVTLKETDEDE